MSGDVETARARAEAFIAAQEATRAARVLQVHADREAARSLSDRIAAEAAEAPAVVVAEALGWLGDLGMLGGTAAEALAQRAEALQRDDGRFDGNDEFGDEAVTGRLVGHLARSPRARLASLDAGADWLAERFTPDLLQGFQWANIAGYAQTFANVLHDAGDEILQWCGRELERGARARQWSAVRTARVLVWCDAPVLPGAKLEPAQIIAAIVAEQAEDGGFGAPDTDRVRETFDAWCGLRLLA